MTAIVWLRRDLRLHDNPALNLALREHDSVVPFFCLDRRLLESPHACARRTEFMLACLHELAEDLKAAGSGLVIAEQSPEAALSELALRCGASAVYAAADISVFARGRDQRVAATLATHGTELELTAGLFTVEDLSEVVTEQGNPYTVFTPFYRRWLDARRRAPYPAPAHLPALPSGVSAAAVPSASELGLQPAKPEREPVVSFPAGEAAARRALARTVHTRARDYATNHDLLASEGGSELSPYLHFGSVSTREVESQLEQDEGSQALRRQLCWRDFYAQVLLSNPGNSKVEHQPRYRRKITWSRSMDHFDAWRQGRTGYPVVDAGMRQLANTGWMHNRARMIVGSFLVKDLGIDWRWGERWFMQTLLDGDQANNNGNWQWIASVGVDPQPMQRRIYNPTLQQQRFDPDGDYVRTYVPELKDVPDRYLAEPWTMPEEVQKEANCMIGSDYPEPIVDHKQARQQAIDRYAQAAGR